MAAKIIRTCGKKNSNNTKYQFWQQDNHPVELTDNFIMQQKLDYIHKNLVEAGFVKQEQDYLYSSAGDYCGEKGLLKIDLLE